MKFEPWLEEEQQAFLIHELADALKHLTSTHILKENLTTWFSF